MRHKRKPPPVVTGAALEGIGSSTSAFTNNQRAYRLQADFGPAASLDPPRTDFVPIGVVADIAVERLALAMAGIVA